VLTLHGLFFAHDEWTQLAMISNKDNLQLQEYK